MATPFAPTCENTGCKVKAFAREWLGTGDAFIYVCLGCRVPLRAYERLDGKVVVSPSQLRLTREARGMGREELAAALGITEWDVWLYETDRAVVPDALIGLWAEATDYPVDRLAMEGMESETDGVLPGSLLWHTPKKDLCEECETRLCSALCDFREAGRSCDRRLCDWCRYRVNPRLDYCKVHSPLAQAIL